MKRLDHVGRGLLAAPEIKPGAIWKSCPAKFAKRHYTLFLMARNLCLLFALMMMSGAGRAVAEEQPTGMLTIEAVDGALFVSGPVDTLQALHDSLSGDLAAASTTVKALRNRVRADYGDIVSFVPFWDAGTLSQGTRQWEMPIRRAALTGVLPPIEGLDPKAAQRVFAATGFAVFSRDDWNALNPAGQVAQLAAAHGPVALLSGTDPQDTVTLIFFDAAEQ
jgi:hypothetical protein